MHIIVLPISLTTQPNDTVTHKQILKCGTFLCDECKLGGQLPFQSVSVVSFLDHLSLHFPHLKFRCIHDILQRRLAVGNK